MITIERAMELSAVASLRERYIKSLGGRRETYLEELLSAGVETYQLSFEGQSIGYFCVSAKKTLLQFFIDDMYLPYLQDALRTMVRGHYIEKALVLTRDRSALSAVLEFKKDVSVDCYVFEEGPERPSVAIDFEDICFRQATLEDVPAIRAACGDFHDFLHFTLEGSINTGDIYVLYSGDIVLGTGVIGAKSFQPPYVDIGMCVNENYRKRGIGSYIIAKLREECSRQGWIAGASCMYHNIGSKKTLEKAGMISKDLVIKVTF